MTDPLSIARDVPLAPMTSLELGGTARYFVRAIDEAQLVRALEWATSRDIACVVLGRGSNVVVGDGRLDALVVQLETRGLAHVEQAGFARVRAAAGESWDALVAEAVARGFGGIECLSGIPGLVGATPIQNVGAYGQEVSQTLASVRVLNRATLEIEEMSAAQCEFAYRTSIFKREPSRFIVLSVELRLELGGAPVLRYAELKKSLHNEEPTLAAVRKQVLALRRGKSMVIEPSDPNRRSVGSFFTNPIVDDATADRIAQGAGPATMPRYPVETGTTKLAAGWLIEHAGVVKGLRRGPVGVSSNHALALVHHGGGTTAQLLALAAEIRQRVLDRFGVELVAEPVALGTEFPWT